MIDEHEHDDFRVKLAVIEEKLEAGFKELRHRFNDQFQVDKNQDARINKLEETKASKQDLKELAAIMKEQHNENKDGIARVEKALVRIGSWFITTVMGAFIVALITKSINLW